MHVRHHKFQKSSNILGKDPWIGETNGKWVQKKSGKSHCGSRFVPFVGFLYLKTSKDFGVQGSSKDPEVLNLPNPQGSFTHIEEWEQGGTWELIFLGQSKSGMCRKSSFPPWLHHWGDLPKSWDFHRAQPSPVQFSFPAGINAGNSLVGNANTWV